MLNLVYVSVLQQTNQLSRAKTLQRIIAKALQYENPENIVSILARKKDGYLESAEGLGMPFACHTKLLLKYLLES